MNTSTSKTLQDYLINHSFVQISYYTAAITITLLLAILAEREILRMSRPESVRRNVLTFATVVVPMATIFAAVIVIRFMKLA